MNSEVEIFKAEYIEFQITIPDGSVLTFKFNNQQIRGDVTYKKGNFTQLFVSPNGSTSSMAQQGGKEIRFTLRVYEDAASRIAWQGLVDHTQNRYSCVFKLHYWISPYTDFSLTSGSSQVQTNVATLNNAIIEIKDHTAEGIARGEGARYPSEVEVIVREGSGLALIQLPLSILDCTSAPPCGVATIDATGSTKLDGSLITSLTTGVKMRYQWGSFATAEIDPGGDATDISDWTFISGSWGATGFEKRIVDQMTGGNGVSFTLGTMALAYFSSVSSIAFGLNVIEGTASASQDVCNLLVDDYDQKFTFQHSIASPGETINLVTRWWNTCRALVVYADDADEFETTNILTNRQLSFDSAGTKVTTVKSSVDLREITLSNEKITSFTLNDLGNLEILTLSSQLTPSSGGFYRGSLSSVDQNSLQNLVLTNAPNVREVYAVDCNLQQNSLLFGTHNNLETLSIDYNPVLTMGLLADINLITSIRRLRVGNNPLGGVLTNPSFTQPNLEELQANNANISGTCTITNTRIRVIRLADNPNMTSFSFLTYRSVEILDLRQTPITYTVSPSPDLLELGLPLNGSIFNLNGSPLLQKLEIEDNTSIQVISLLTNTAIRHFSAQGCTSLRIAALPFTSGVTVDFFEVTGCIFDYTDSNNHFTRYVDFTDVNGCTIILTNNGMTASEIDDILIDLDTVSGSGFSGRSIDLRNNTAPTSASASAIASLVTKGFTVNTD